MQPQPDPLHNVIRTLKTLKTLACIGAVLSFSNPLLADAYDLIDGQANVPGQFDYLSLDLGARVNDDTLGSGARLSLPVINRHLVVFVDTQNVDGSREGIALNEEVDVSGDVQGGGLYISDLPTWRHYAPTLRLSSHSARRDVDSNIVVSGIQANAELQDKNVSIALLLSPVVAPFENGTNVYVGLGASYQRQRRTVELNSVAQSAFYRYEQDYVPYFAAGIVYAYKRFSIYTAVEHEGDWGLGAGVRIHLRQSTHAKR